MPKSANQRGRKLHGNIHSRSHVESNENKLIQDQFNDLLSDFDQLPIPSASFTSSIITPGVPRYSVVEHNALKKECKMITSEIHEQISPEDRENTAFSHLLCLLYQHKKLEREFFNLQDLCKRYENEKEIMLADQTKAEVVKEALEGIVREFRREHKQVMVECNQIRQQGIQQREENVRMRQEVEKAKILVEKEREKLLQQRKDTEKLQENILCLQEQFKLKEDKLLAESKKRDIEQRLELSKSAKEVKLAQKTVLKISEVYQERLKESQMKTNEVQSHLKQYAQNFEHFQDTLSKSNEIFVTFKQEMERMTKTIARLEKERSYLQVKSEQTDITLIEMVEERNNQRRELDLLKTKNSRLTALCRVLQAERKKEGDTTAMNEENASPPPPS